MNNEDKKTALTGHCLIWFGAAVSIAEIMTGTLFAPLGFWRALVAIVIGHLLGCLLLYYSGVISAVAGKSAMEAVKTTFGPNGGRVFAGLNVLQLAGWTAVMISAGTLAANSIVRIGGTDWLWAVLIGGLILIWIQLRFGILEKLNLATMILLGILSVMLSRQFFNLPTNAEPDGVLSFGDALELSIAMPVSWLPLIGDYTSHTSRPRMTSLVSAGVYFLASCWMYLAGLCAALCLGETDIAVIMRSTGSGIAAILIVILSTVTTTYLDVYSAGISAKSIFPKANPRIMASCVCLIGMIPAILCDTSAFESFLYWIGSVFVPMATIQIMDEIVLRKRHSPRHNLLLWGAGFIVYRVFLHLGLPCGSTIPDILLTGAACLLASSSTARHGADAL